MNCVVVGCKNDQTRPKGMCHAHYYRHLRAKRAGLAEGSAEYKLQVFQKPLRPRGHSKYADKKCEVYGCDNDATIKYKCHKCYMREYMKARREKVESKARKYDEIMAKASSAVVQTAPTGEREAASPSLVVERVAHETGLPIEQIQDMYDEGEFDGLDEGEMIEYAKEWTNA